MATLKEKVFAIKEAWVSAYTSGVAATWQEIEIVSDGQLTYGIGQAEVTDGEGELDSIFYHSRRVSLTLTCRKTVMAILERLTGNAVSSANGVERIRFGTAGDLTPPLLRFKLVSRSLDDSNNQRYRIVYLYKCQSRIPSVGMAGTTVGEVNLEATAFKSTDDHGGKTIPTAFGEIGIGYSTTADQV